MFYRKNELKLKNKYITIITMSSEYQVKRRILVKNKKEKNISQTQTQTQTQIKDDDISLYISQLSDKEKIVLEIAKDHLETSFCIEKSIGYLNWLKNKNKI